MAGAIGVRAGIGSRLGGNLFLAILSGMFLANLALIFFYVPTERVMGIVQRIFYFHVPLALVGFLSFFIVFIASILYLVEWSEKGDRRAQAAAKVGIVQRIFYFHVPLALVGSLRFFTFLIVFIASILHLVERSEKGDRRAQVTAEEWDRLAQAAAEVGVVFLTGAIISGAIWAKPVWGTWWTWDPKLTTTFILWVIYIGYLMVRNLAPSRGQAARYSAVIGIIGAIDIPIVYMASEWWRTLHPELVAGPLAETGNLESSMRFVFYFSILTFTLLLFYLIQARTAQRRAEEAVEELRRAYE